MRTFFILPALLLISPLSACSDDSSSDGDTGRADTVDTAGDAEAETVTFDTEQPDTGQPEAVDGGDFGKPCTTNTDCESGWCVDSPDGFICTKECLEECPDGFDCRSILNSRGDLVFLCQPRVLKLCVSCLEDIQCNGGRCLEIDGSMQCAAGCEEEGDCPEGYTCQPDAGNSESEELFCQPVSGTCSCSPPFAGVTQLCTRDNELGACLGTETCDPTVGWVDCTAPDPIEEVCNFLDDDCDGDVDEDFKIDGVYAHKDSCGSCTTVCDEVVPNAAETECVVTEGTPRCQVLTCDPGYTQINAFVCAPEASSLCQECIASAECLGTDAACTTLDDGDFCTLPCDRDEDCAVGFVCRDTDDNGLQCVPESGSCTCDGSNTNLARSCSKIFTPDDPEQPVVTCTGFEQCTVDGWGGCELPDDECDGIDNDCDGVIDGPHKTGDKYTTIENCGACGISCLAFARPNAMPICDASDVVPVCSYECAGTAVDVNGLTDDGCECVPVPGADLAGDDVDSNCDGVDGEVDNAIFVSKEGDDDNPGTRELPVLTPVVGLEKAKAANKRDVYVATGVYSQNIVLEEGVGIFGGYSPDFSQHDVLLYETAFIGDTPDDEHVGTITAIGVGQPGSQRETVIDGFTIFGVNAGNISGGNSYAIYVRNSGSRLRVSNNRIWGGPGGNGEAGARGADGANGADGTPGDAAKNLSSNCTTSDESSGGDGGTLTCADGANVSGGDGGKASCPDFSVAPPNTAKGSAGFGIGSGDGGLYGSPFLICATPDGADPGCDPYPYSCLNCWRPTSWNGRPGDNGSDGTNGAAGTSGADTGSTDTGGWVGSAGGGGGDGTNGSGGGGGGAGGGVEVDGTACTAEAGDDDLGGSGGGGGSGGCLATGGQGGLPGGGSFGIFVVGSSATHTPTLTDNVIQAGRGGAGGAGGAGGVGGTSGKGGAGGVSGDQLGELVRCAAGGGSGGNGGAGGHGGGGGGGAGGPAYALYVDLPANPPSTWKLGNNFESGGQGGSGGPGGVSIDQSRSGENGTNGIAADTNF